MRVNQATYSFMGSHQCVPGCHSVWLFRACRDMGGRSTLPDTKKATNMGVWVAWGGLHHDAAEAASFLRMYASRP